MRNTFYTPKSDTNTNTTATSESGTRYRCRHIFTDGRRCGSPSLRHDSFCYYHHTTRRSIEDPAARKARLGSFHFPGPAELADRSGVQLALAQVLERIASNDLEPRRAGLLLYGLPKPAPAAPPALTDLVKEVVPDEVLGPVAPTTEFDEDTYAYDTKEGQSPQNSPPHPRRAAKRRLRLRASPSRNRPRNRPRRRLRTGTRL